MGRAATGGRPPARATPPQCGRARPQGRARSVVRHLPPAVPQRAMAEGGAGSRATSPLPPHAPAAAGRSPPPSPCAGPTTAAAGLEAPARGQALA
eukprot:gene34104-66581_t